MDNNNFKLTLNDMNNEIDAAASLPAYNERDFEAERRASREGELQEEYDDGTAVFLNQEEFIAQFVD